MSELRTGRLGWGLAARALLVLAALVAGYSLPAEAKVLRVEIERRVPLLGGQMFGDVGAYEVLEGRVHFGFDPANPANQRVTDLALAPTEGDGLVHAWSELLVLQPKDAARRRGTAVVEVVNRGRRLALGALNRVGIRFGADARFDPESPADVGDGFLMEQGLTIVWIGWQADAPDTPGSMRLRVPAARGLDGQPVRGLARSDWVVEAATTRLPLAALGHAAIAAADPASPQNVLTVRDTREGARQVVPRARWGFDRERTSIESEAGFTPGRIYELVYLAQDPPILGLGFAAFRDIVSYARHDATSPFPVKRGVALGSSQSGRFLRHFLYDGFNRDEQGRQAYDGVVIHIGGAGRGGFNSRFGHPGRVGNPFQNFFYPGDDFPFASRAAKDPAYPAEPKVGIFDRAIATRTFPKLFQINTGYEYWGRVASLVHMTPDGNEDLAPLDDERLYHVASAPHYPLPFPPRPEQEVAPDVYRGSPLDTGSVSRALLQHMLAWVERETRPPDSLVPRIANTTLVPPASLRYPLRFLPTPKTPHVAYALDFGPRWGQGIVDNQPPKSGPAYAVRVPQIDGLGNEATGIRTLAIRVPIGTWTPWALRTGMPVAADEMADYFGTFVPLARTPEERREGDLRAALAERYASEDAYLAEVDVALDQLAAEGWLLGRDRAFERQAALERWQWALARQPGAAAAP